MLLFDKVVVFLIDRENSFSSFHKDRNFVLKFIPNSYCSGEHIHEIFDAHENVVLP